jgi:hypothetical protein
MGRIHAHIHPHPIIPSPRTRRLIPDDTVRTIGQHIVCPFCLTGTEIHPSGTPVVYPPFILHHSCSRLSQPQAPQSQRLSQRLKWEEEREKREGGLRIHQQTTYNNTDNTIANHSPHCALPSTSSIVLYRRNMQPERLKRKRLNSPRSALRGKDSAICLRLYGR